MAVIDVFSLPRVDAAVPLEESWAALAEIVSLGKVRTQRRGTDLVVAVPRALLGKAQAGAGIDFQWTAACGDSGRRVDRLDRGDAAPDGRFVFRYRPQ